MTPGPLSPTPSYQPQDYKALGGGLETSQRSMERGTRNAKTRDRFRRGLSHRVYSIPRELETSLPHQYVVLEGSVRLGALHG